MAAFGSLWSSCGAGRSGCMQSILLLSCGVLTYLGLPFLFNHIWSLSCQEAM